MLFNSLSYLIFLPIVVGLYWLVPVKARIPLLLIASYVFYMFWKPIYGLLILALTLINYALGLLLAKTPTHKKLVLTLSIVINVAVLVFFKYAYFLHDAAQSISNFLHLPQPPGFAFSIILPLGISFFVFEFIHYLVDIYRGGQPVRSLLQFALFPSFFPTQIAGPIKRYQDFIPQLNKKLTLSSAEFNEAIELILFGMFKKVCLADNLALIVNRCYAHVDILNGADLWLAAFAFSFQIYFDFSGYTDIARGSAQLLGFKVPLNFNLPYLSNSITEVWRRWHISLSSWLRDYLFIPLGGSKHGTLFTYRNLFITMAIGGLWHGASMHYLAWGMFMGALLILHKEWRRLCDALPAMLKITETKLFNIIAIALTFCAWTVGLVIFRAENMKVAGTVLGKLFDLSQAFQPPTMLTTSSSILFALLPFALIVLFAAQIVVSKLKLSPGIMPDFPKIPGFKPVYLAMLLIILLVSCPDSTPSFIYFQF
ncbi:MAG: hypothetical protein K2X29_10980 [Candidatus Obscuribacterales bacterium]|nr:hypothetical protein [Candidatus Obscuribacterales bacterium]